MLSGQRFAGSAMRTSRLPAFVPVAALLALPGLASANCYSIYDAKNQLSFQSTVAPVDLSVHISVGMRARFPGGYLVIIPDDSDCREFRTGPTTSPRFDATSPTQAPPQQVLEAPILGGASAAGTATDGATTVRSGTNLNIRRP
jgi:hypothetical protein